MITLFTLPKAFRGHSALIQENAIGSWRALGADIEIILFGADEGIDSAALSFGCIHRPAVPTSEFGTPLLGPVFAEAQAIAKWPLLVYVNADIIFLPDLLKAVQHLRQLPQFLACGQRIDVWVERALTFEPTGSATGWLETLRETGRLHRPTGSDYFVFPRGTVKLPAFSVGRPGWDNWLIFAAKQAFVPVIDATNAITAIHQNHDYSHSAFGTRGAVHGPEYLTNIKLAGGYSRMLDLRAAEHVLNPDGVSPAPRWRRFRAQALSAAPTRSLVGLKRRLQNALTS
jgi:hypothetical protein